MLYQFAEGPLASAAGVEPGSVKEMLSVPFQQTARYLKEYPDDVRLYKLYVQYYYFTNNGAGISDVISKVKNRGIYLDSEGKQWFDAWNPDK